MQFKNYERESILKHLTLLSDNPMQYWFIKQYRHDIGSLICRLNYDSGTNIHCIWIIVAFFS